MSSGQVFGFQAAACKDLMELRALYNSGQLDKLPERTDRARQFAGLETYCLLEPLGPGSTDTERGGTLFEAKALHMEWSPLPVWFVRNLNRGTPFNLFYNGISAGTINETPTSSLDMQTALRAAGATDCFVWGTGTRITAEDGTTEAMDASCWFVVFPSGVVPADMTCSIGGQVYRLDMIPHDGIEHVRLGKPIKYQKSLLMGQFVTAIPQVGRGTVAIMDEFSSSSSSSADGNPSCGCCNCYQCIPSDQAVVGSCDAAPNGAPYQYQLNWGANPWSDDGGTSNFTTLSWGDGICVSVSSSSMASEGGSSDSGCTWYSCPATLCEPSSSSSSSSGSSSSSSSSAPCGDYQLVMELFTITDPVTDEIVTACTVKIVFLGVGDDWMGAGT